MIGKSGRHAAYLQLSESSFHGDSRFHYADAAKKLLT